MKLKTNLPPIQIIKNYISLRRKAFRCNLGLYLQILYGITALVKLIYRGMRPDAKMI